MHTMTRDDRAPLHVDIALHRQVKILAAEQGVSMKALTERLLELGLAVERAPNGATARELYHASLALQGDPNA